MTKSFTKPNTPLGADVRGVPVSYNDTYAIAALDAAITNSLVHQGKPIAEINTVLKEHPDFIMGWLFKAGSLTQWMEKRVHKVMIMALAEAEKRVAFANEREQGHLRAIKAWIEGDFFGAIKFWEDVLLRYPHDLWALEQAHLGNVLIGDVSGTLDVVKRASNVWDENVPGYEFFLGFLSFGLEENRDFSHAEDIARQAISLRQDHPYAAHTIAHVMEMRGHQLEGIQFLKKNAAALLWRLELVGQETGDRWVHLAKKWGSAASDLIYVFNDMHAMLCFSGDKRKGAQEALISANEQSARTSLSSNAILSREVGLLIFKVLRDFSNNEYGSCVDWVLQVHRQIYRIGGSAAQRDLIHWTATEAALRGKYFELALALSSERTAAKPTSPQNWRLAARAFHGGGDQNNAAKANEKAELLLIQND